MPQDRAHDSRRVPPAVERTEYHTDYDDQTRTFMKKSDLQARDGWVSPHPQSLPNGQPNPDYTKMVK